MSMKDWIKSAGEKIRDAIEHAVPLPPRPVPAPVRIPARLGPRRPHRGYC